LAVIAGAIGRSPFRNRLVIAILGIEVPVRSVYLDMREGILSQEIL